ncbi:MAG: ferritin-like domain-containing protein [Thermoleophilaceae bacterium]
MSNANLAAPELAAVEVNGITRESFILRSALAAGSVYGLGAVGPFVSQALAQEGSGDIGILNFALSLEYLEAAFYKQANKEVADLSGQAKSISETLEKDEQTHVEALTKTIKDLGGKPVKAPTVDFGDAFADQKSYLKLAQTFEDTGVSAYNGAGPSIKSKEVLAAAGSIVQVEARHAAGIRTLRGQKAAPTAFDKALQKPEVEKLIKPYVGGPEKSGGEKDTGTGTGTGTTGTGTGTTGTGTGGNP